MDAFHRFISPLAEWQSRRKERERAWVHKMQELRGASPEQQLQEFEQLKHSWYRQLQQDLLHRQAAKDARVFMARMNKEAKQRSQLECCEPAAPRRQACTAQGHQPCAHDSPANGA